MPRYFFRFISPTRLAGSSWKIHQKFEQKLIKLNFPTVDSVMMIFDKRIKKRQTFLHYGLGFDVQLPASNKEIARAQAESLVMNILSLITFLEACYAGVPTNILSYRIPECGLELEEYTALIVDKNYSPLETTLRPINLNRVNDFMGRMMLANAEVRLAVDNMLHWFWRALGSRDLKDRFINLWISLEFLEESLKKKFDLPSGSSKKQPRCYECGKEIFLPCPECGKSYYYKSYVGQTGFKELEKKISERIMKFGELQEFRSQLFHSNTKATTKSPDDFRNAIYSIRVLLNYAVFDLLELDFQYAIPMAKVEMRVISLPTFLAFEGDIKVKEKITINDVEKQPSVIGEYEFNYKVEDNDELTSLIDVKHNFDGAFESGKIKKIIKEDSSHMTKKVWEREIR